MPPEKSSSTSLESLDPLELLDDIVQELLKEAGIPPVAGGGLPGFLQDAWNWVKGDLLDPGGAFIAGVLSEIGRTVAGAVTTVLSWILKWVYHLVRFSLWYAVPSGHRLRYPSVYKESTQSPYAYLSRLFRIGGSVVEGLLGGPIRWVVGRLNAVGHWLWGLVSGAVTWVVERVEAWGRWVWRQVSGGVNWIVGRVNAVAQWLWGLVTGGQRWAVGRVEAWGRWVWEQVSAGQNWVVGRVEAWGRWVWGQVTGGQAWIVGRLNAAAHWLWGLVKDGLDWAWDHVISKIPEGIVRGAAEIGKLIREAFEWLINTAFEPMVGFFQKKISIIPKFVRGEYDTLDELIDDILDPAPLVLAGFAGLVFLAVVVLPALSLTLSTITRESVEPMRQRLAAQIGTRTVFEGTGRELLQRGEWDEGTYLDHLHRQGFSDGTARAIMVLAEQIPGPSDLVRMGVREVFTPEIAEAFGQFEDFPPAFGDWMGKQGFTEEWARNFWGAHWDLPSVTQGFEMFHRDVIPESELQLLLRALDVMPHWRDKLTEIAYRVITRVDVRRMYAEGVFDRGQVLRVYRDLGYKPEDAEALTEFVVLRYPPKGAETADDLRSVTASTIKQALARRLISEDDALEGLQELDYTPDDAQLIVSIWQFDWTQDPSLRSDVNPKGLARSVIEKAYERRLIDLNAGVRELGELGYTPEDARLLLQLVDLRLEEQLADLEIDGLVGDYQDGVITDGQLAAALADLHVPEARVDFLLRREILSRQAKRRRLTLSQMKKALAERLMDVGEYRDRLDVMGYNDRDVDILVALNVGSV